MTLESLRSQMAGIAAVTITPFIPGSLDVDHDGLRRVVRLMEDAGIDVIVPCGGTGEYYALTEQERREVVETVLDEVRHTPVVVGIGTGVREAIAATRHAEAHGAAGVMVHQPIGAGIHPAGILDYYRAIAAATDLGIVAYVRDPMFSAEVLTEVGQIPNVVAVKYAIDNPKLFAMTVEAVSTSVDLVWLCGTAESWAPFFWPGGAIGFTSGLANVAPEKAVAMRAALKSGDPEAIHQSWSDARQIEDLRDRQCGANNVSIVKLAAELCGLCSSAVRPPLSAPSPADRADLERLLAAWGKVQAVIT